MKCGVLSASVKCEESVHLALRCTGVARRSCSWTTTAQQVRTKHAGLAGARRTQVLLMRKVLEYNPKATSGPPRAGTTGVPTIAEVYVICI
jgi:hypothetical protein